jgi:hypothetical protein
MRGMFYVWGYLGLFICGIGTFSLFGSPTTPTIGSILMITILVLMWTGGMILFGLTAILQYLEWKPVPE